MLLTREMKSPKQRQNNVLTAKHNFKNLIKSQGTKGKKLHYKKHGKFQYFEVFQVTLRSFCVLGDAWGSGISKQHSRPDPFPQHALQKTINHARFYLQEGHRLLNVECQVVQVGRFFCTGVRRRRRPPHTHASTHAN